MVIMQNMIFEKLVKSKYDKLSAGKQRVAKYILSSLEEASYSTISQLQKKIGVSETTIIRFAYELGYTGFSEMQKAIQKEILYRGSNNHIENSDQYLSTDKEKYAEIINRDIAILEETIKNLEIDKLEEAASLITEAEEVMVIGHHTSYASAYWFSVTLGLMMPSVRLLDQKNAYQELLNVTEKTVVLAISFPRYRKETYEIVRKVANEKGKVIAVTDSELAPISRIANVYLLTKTNRDESGYNAISPVISLLNILIVCIRKKNKELINNRLLKLESFYEKDDSLFE